MVPTDEEVLSEARKTIKAELVRRLVERTFSEEQSRVEHFLAGASIKLGKELKTEIPL